MHVALDKITDDIIKTEGGGVTRVQDGRFIVQQVQSKLRTNLAEWIPDPSVGWLSGTDFEKNFDQFALERRARLIILATQGILSINKMSSTYSNRKLIIQFSASTIYGDIDVTVPWGVN